MNIKKSLNVALAQRGITKLDFAKQLGISRARLYAIQNQKRLNPETLIMLSSGLGIEVSEFIKLGEC